MRDSSQVFVSRFRCPTEDVARGLVNALMVEGLYPDLHEPRTPGEPWEVAAPVELVVTEGNLTALQADMARAARRCGAVFDGCDPEG